MGGYVLPTASTPGYTTFRGKVACDCLAKWLPVFERVLIAHGLVRESIDILQLTGDYSLSGGNHKAGGVFDIKQYDERVVAIAREMGAPGTWMRNMKFPDGSPGNTHTHGALSGCAHAWPAIYQITAQKRGYDGMGQGAAGTAYAGQWGYGGPDPHPDPKTYRTWAQGVAWAAIELARIESEKDPLSALTDYQLARLIAASDRVLGGLPPGAALQLDPQGEKRRVADASDVGVAVALLRGIAEKVGAPVDVDEAAIAKGVVEGLREPIRAMIVSAVAAGDSPETTADAVLAKLGAAATAAAAQ